MSVSKLLLGLAYLLSSLKKLATTLLLYTTFDITKENVIESVKLRSYFKETYFKCPR